MSNTQPIIDTATAAAEPTRLSDTLYGFVVPNAGTVRLIDIETQRPTPLRKRGHVTLHTAGSLATYVTTHMATGTSIYADVERATIVAVMNDHSVSEPGWGDHQATLTLRHPPGWRLWMSRNAQLSTQEKFAEHIESGLAEIVEPPAADLLEIAQHFQANIKVAFRSAKSLANGQRQLTYEETIDSKAGQKGQLTVPETFTVALQPFEGSATFRVLARLRTRISDGTLAIGYVLDRPEKIWRHAFDDVLTEIAEVTRITIYNGTPTTKEKP